MKFVYFAAVLLAPVVSVLAGEVPEKVVARMGGLWDRPDALPGKIFIVNAQKTVAMTNMSSAIAIIKSNTNVRNLEIVEGKGVTPMTAAEEVKKLGASAAIFLVECDKCSTTMLVAPENRWAILNVGALKADGAAQAYCDARARKELVRTFLMLTGAIDSNYPNSLMSFIGSVKDLDKLPNENPPLDVVGRTRNYLPKMGVEARRKATYRQACKEGWAPAPTNDVQKAIWNELHAIPTAPIKIKPENHPAK